MLHYAGIQERFWAEAVLNANYVKNRVPTKSVEGMVPYEAFWGRKPSVDYFRDAFAQIPQVGRKKFDPRSKKVVFMGYDQESKAYRLWDPEKNRVIINRDVKFNEVNFGERIFHSERKMAKEDSQNSLLEVEITDGLQDTPREADEENPQAESETEDE